MVALQNGGKADKPLNETFDALPTTIFTVMTNLAIEHGSVNLGQGFPDDEGPKSMKVTPSSTHRSMSLLLAFPVNLQQFHSMVMLLYRRRRLPTGLGGHSCTRWAQSVHKFARHS